jgi:hypothetical protein
MRRLIALLIVLAVAFGAPYASALINRLMGPWSAEAIEADGSRTRMEFGQDLPRPDWVPVYPGALVVQASNVVSAREPSGFHALDLATRAALDDVKRFYTARLAAAGFAVRDLGTWPSDARSAAALGLDATLFARRAATDDQIDIQIRSPEGFAATRLLQIHWRKISAAPPGSEPPATAGGM